MARAWPFDSESAQSYTRVRQAFFSQFLGEIRGQVRLESAADVGCGVGYFSKFLSDLGFRVVAVDGREENTKEGQRRYPRITFLTRDVEDASLPEMGGFDLVLCVGLLYHMENPFRVIRNLYALTEKVLFIESMCAPRPEPGLLLLDEGPDDDQSLNYVAFYPSESCLVKMLYRSGFPYVYRCKKLPKHKFFDTTIWRKRERTILAASKVALASPNLVPAKEVIRPVPGISDPWTTALRRARAYAGRLTNPLRGRV